MIGAWYRLYMSLHSAMLRVRVHSVISLSQYVIIAISASWATCSCLVLRTLYVSHCSLFICYSAYQGIKQWFGICCAQRNTPAARVARLRRESSPRTEATPRSPEGKNRDIYMREYIRLKTKKQTACKHLPNLEKACTGMPWSALKQK